MSFGKLEQTNNPFENKQNKSVPESSKNYFEKDKRPNYRYYYHGTFRPLYEKVEADGIFKFREHVSNLSLSPDFSFKFLADEVSRGPEQLIGRLKHLLPRDKERFDQERLSDDEAILLIMEPGEKYRVHSSAEGAPNVFSSADQIPNDVDQVIRTRTWDTYQQTMSKEPIQKINSSEIKHPGLHLNRKMLGDGTWEKIPADKRIELPGELPAAAIKMAIKKNPEFLGILKDLNNSLRAGGPIDFSKFKNELFEYFKSGQGIIKDDISDKKELAENMVMSEVEHYLVSTARRLYLDTQKSKGKKILKGKKFVEDSRPVMNRDQILQKIERLKSINPENEVLKRYISIISQDLVNEV